MNGLSPGRWGEARNTYGRTSGQTRRSDDRTNGDGTITRTEPQCDRELDEQEKEWQEAWARLRNEPWIPLAQMKATFPKPGASGGGGERAAASERRASGKRAAEAASGERAASERHPSEDANE